MNHKEFKYYGGYYYLWIFLVLLIGFFLFSCKTTQTKTSDKTTIKTVQTIEEQDSGRSTTDTKAAGTVETNLQKNERENSYYILFYPPDSTGKQYPQEIGGTNKEVATNLTSRSEWELSINSRFEYLFGKIENLEQQISGQSKTTEKTGFTWLEKTGLVTIGLLLLIIIYTVIKWSLKIKK